MKHKIVCGIDPFESSGDKSQGAFVVCYNDKIVYHTQKKWVADLLKMAAYYTNIKVMKETND